MMMMISYEQERLLELNGKLISRHMYSSIKTTIKNRGQVIKEHRTHAELQDIVKT
jgi:hypothetical protein